MVTDPLLDTAGPVDSLTIERSSFIRRGFTWKEGERQFSARLKWGPGGRLVSREEDGHTELYAYDDAGNLTASYRMNTDGQIVSRELLERDESSRLRRRIIRDSETEETVTYEYDGSGRMTAERRGNRIRVEKTDRDGRVVQEYLYDGEQPDLVSDYQRDESGRLTVVTIGNPDGKRHRKTVSTYDDAGRPASETVYDSEDRVIRDETYVYGAVHGDRWLERVTWVPDGRGGRRRRPREVVYRSFGFGDDPDRNTAGSSRSVPFANGVYTGPVVAGVPQGTGVFIYNDDSRYEGEFRDGLMNGHGRLIWPDGRMMEGEFRNGMLEGEGTCVWPDGASYRGGFSGGRMHGAGIFVWADGTRFEGLFEDGHRTDQGAWDRPGIS